MGKQEELQPGCNIMGLAEIFAPIILSAKFISWFKSNKLEVQVPEESEGN